MTNYEAIRLLLNDDTTQLKEDITKYFNDKEVFEKIPSDFINVVREIVALKAKTLPQKNIVFTKDADIKLYNEFQEKNGNFFEDLNIYIEAFGQIVVWFDLANDAKAITPVFLIPGEFEIKNDKIYKIEFDESGSDTGKRKLLQANTYLQIGAHPKDTELYRKAIGVNFTVALLNMQAKYQGQSFMWAKGIDGKDNTISAGADTITYLESTSDAGIGFVSPDTKITDLTSVISQKLIIACRSEGVPDDYMTLQGQPTQSSGYAIKLRNEPLDSYYAEQSPYLVMVVNKFFLMWKELRSSLYLPYITDAPIITDKTKSEMLTFSESMEVDNFLLKQKLIDKIDIAMKYLKLTEDEAKKYISDRAIRDAEYGAVDSVTGRIQTILGG